MTTADYDDVLALPRHDDKRIAYAAAMATLGYIQEFYDGKPITYTRLFGPLATHKRQLLYAELMRNFGWEVDIESRKDILYGPVNQSRPPDVHHVRLTRIPEEAAA